MGSPTSACMPTQVMGSAYLSALEAYPILYEPEADDLWKRRDIPDLAETILGRMLLGVELDSLGDFDVATGEGGKYVGLRTRIGVVFGSGYNWPLALAQALAAYAELLARSRLTIAPIPQKEAFDFIRRVHRHHKAPAGDKFRLGAFAKVNDFDMLVGVAVVGRPTSRELQKQGAWEVTRVAVLEGGQNLCSALYTAAWKEAQKRGVARVVTYLLETESGASLRAAGWQLVREHAGGGTWSRAARPRTDKAPVCRKQRWEHLAELKTQARPSREEHAFSFASFIASKAAKAERALRKAQRKAEQLT